MPDTYNIQSTSRQSAAVSDVVLNETETTRVILRPLIVENPHNQKANLKITIVHQRKGSTQKWEDTQAILLSSLRSGEGVRLALDSETTLKLFTELKNLFEIGGGGVLPGESRLIVAHEDEVVLTDPSKAKMINDMLAKEYPDDIWEALVAEHPDLVTKLSFIRLQETRQAAVEEFTVSISQERDEAYWQDFFEKNTWIFGYGLRYQILRTVQNQPNYGGQNVSGSGGQRGDFLQATDAETKFTVLVEIKTPQSALVGSTQYRNGAMELGRELIGGVSQLQTNCRKWERSAVEPENVEVLSGINTVRPKGILIIGNSASLNTLDKKNTFQQFRENMNSPEIITYDELLARAKYINEHFTDEPGESGTGEVLVVEAAQAVSTEINLDEIPF